MANLDGHHRHFRISNFRAFTKKLECECGTVESALVLIPTVILFLSVLQIAASVLGRGVALNNMQSEINREALVGSNQTHEGTAISRIPLPGGGSIIVGNGKSSIFKLTPLLAWQDKFNTSGIAIDEN
jgi:hypothetical protein